MAPVGGHKIEYTAGDEGKRDRIGADHPLAMRGNMAIACGDESGGGADHPRSGLHRGSGEAGTAPRESDPRERTDQNGNHVYAAKYAMEREMALSNPRREIDWPDQESEDSGQCVRYKQLAIGDHLQTVSVIHRVISNEEDL